jgi:hypothetical protein
MSQLELVALIVRDWRRRVLFVPPPRGEPYGRVAVFLDLEGNRWGLPGRDSAAVADARSPA